MKKADIISKVPGSRSACSRLLLAALAGFMMFSCSSESDQQAQTYQSLDDYEATAEPVDDGKGIGPVTEVRLGEIDPQLVEAGHTLFDNKCSACHRMDATKVVGPGLAGITERRKPEWVMNMIINPEEMTKKDPTAKKLLAEHLTQMTNQNVSQEDARALLEYFRQQDAQN